ncbi:hypothetical protein BOO25_20825 [Vibrio navarrensis]|nr:hypothetical protein [Vibrio navarrensis]
MLGKRFGGFLNNSFADVSKSAWFAQITTFLQLILMSKFVGCFIGNRSGWLKFSLAQRCFDFLSRMNELLVLSWLHLATKLSKRFGFRSSQCGNLVILCQVNEYEIVTPNKKFKPDYQRAAESALKWFCDYGALLKVTLCVGSSLIWRYV